MNDPRSLRGRLVRAAAAAGLVLAAACGDSPSAPDALEIRDIILVDEAGEVVAYSHDDHWHGSVRVRAGETRALWAYFTDVPSGHDAPESRFTLEAHADHALRIASEDDSAVAWTGNRFALTVQGLRAGGWATTFAVVRGRASVFEAPPVLVFVTE